MRPVQLTVNGRMIFESVEPRMHLADFLRERINLTGTHLRCEQGACGACTLLIDGQPARSCIIFAVLCDGAAITTIEGLENDPIIAALRRAFSEEHGLQCGYCTPGMLMTARDIITRLPDADEKRIRLELSGNLCRCTGYVGIVRAVSRVLVERRNGELTAVFDHEAPLGPVGARSAEPGTAQSVVTPAAATARVQPVASSREAILGLGGPPADKSVEGKMTVKLGPVPTSFTQQARIVRNEARKRGVTTGSGRNQSGGSRAAGEVEYALASPGSGGGTQVSLMMRALVAPLRAGALFRQVLMAPLKATFARILGSPKL